jgi:hypothetical protein
MFVVQKISVNFDRPFGEVEFSINLVAFQEELGGSIGLMREAMFVDFAEEFEGISAVSRAIFGRS